MKMEGGVAFLASEEMADADREATERFGIGVPVLMEKAGLATATMARRYLGGNTVGSRVLCLAGKGNNGGDGLVAARYLANWGCRVQVFLGAPRGELKELPAQQLRAAEAAGIDLSGPDSALPDAELIVDALLGYSSRGNPREPVAGLIRRANESRIPILAVDLPSGLDASSGEAGEPCIVANSTVTFGFPKTGFLNPKAAHFVGRLYLADISVPDEIYRKHGMVGRPFKGEGLVELFPKGVQGF